MALSDFRDKKVLSLEERQKLLSAVAENEAERSLLFPSLYKGSTIISAVDVMNKADNVYHPERVPQVNNTQYNIVLMGGSEGENKRLGEAVRWLTGGKVEEQETK